MKFVFEKDILKLKKIWLKQKDKIDWERFENQFWKDKKLEKILKLILKKDVI